MNPKPLKEQSDLELLELVCELYSRSADYPSKEMCEAYHIARLELETRLLAYQNYVNPINCHLSSLDEQAEYCCLLNRQNIPVGSITQPLSNDEVRRLRKLTRKEIRLTNSNFC